MAYLSLWICTVTKTDSPDMALKDWWLLKYFATSDPELICSEINVFVTFMMCRQLRHKIFLYIIFYFKYITIRENCIYRRSVTSWNVNTYLVLHICMLQSWNLETLHFDQFTSEDYNLLAFLKMSFIYDIQKAIDSCS